MSGSHAWYAWHEGLVLFSLCTQCLSLPPMVLQVQLAPSLCPSYPLQCGLLSTFRCRESVLPVFWLFYGLLTLICMLFNCIHGMW